MDNSMQDGSSLGLPPALPIPQISGSSLEGHPNFHAATILWAESSEQNKRWVQNVVTIADIKKDVTDRQKAADEAIEGFDGISLSLTGTGNQAISNTQIIERICHLNFRVLSTLEPKFVSDDAVNILRKTVVRFLHRMLMLDVSRSTHDGMISCIVQLMEMDNEEVGIQLLKMLLELIKMARPPANQAPGILFSNQLLLQFTVKILKRWTRLPTLIDRIFDMAAVKITSMEGGVVDINSVAESLLCSVDLCRFSNDDNNANNAIVLLPKASNSLRFLAESIYVIMFSQQYLRNKIHESYPTFGNDVLNVMVADLRTDQIEKFIHTLSGKPQEVARVTGAYHEFMLTYCKVPQLFAYVARHFFGNMEQAHVFGEGVVKILTFCPKEIVFGRREILGAIKNVANSEWRIALTPQIPKLLDLDFLVGSANGSKDLLKGTAIAMAMDVLHSLRTQLNITTFQQVIDLCISYFSDRNLGIGLHMAVLRTISTNLSEGIIAAAREENRQEEGRMIFLRVLNMLGLRLKVMVKYSLPIYKSKAKNAAANGSVLEPNDNMDNSSQILTEQRAFLRAIIAGVKTILWSVRECAVEGSMAIRPEDLKVLTRICKYGVQATELFVVGTGSNNSKSSTTPAAGKPSEKEFTEHVADTMKQFPLDVYRDIFQHIFWRFLDLFKDEQLQQILSAALNCLLPYPGFSGITTTTMLDVAIPRFPELAESTHELSSSVLKILKILFGAVSLYPKEVEQYFKPLLQKFFQQGFHLGMRARDPLNLFYMFRAFFRAMGGGGHEVLYHDFLPNLPMILQVLCSFHSQRQKPAFKDIFNELCLIVPVRLSTLMPHISFLAPAILSTMQGPPASASQGLRTLELCIDNMHNDYLYEQLEPVKKDLMKALWNIIQTGNSQMQTTALRFLGKMCGHALKALREPQPLHPRIMEDDLGPCVVLQMPNFTDPLHVPIFRIIEEAYKTLLENAVDVNTRNAAWNVVQTYLLGILRPDPNMHALETLLQHSSFKHSAKTSTYAVVATLKPDAPYPKCTDEKNRLATQICLQGLMVAAATKDFRNTAMPLLAKYVRHFSLMAIVQQHAGFTKPDSVTRGYHHEAIDPFVMLDAIVFILSHEEQNAISKTAEAAIMLILETLTAVYEDLKHCVGLPFLNYLFEKLHSLCYEKAWCCKAGALTGISPLIEYMPLTWTMEMSALIIRGLMYVLRDSFQAVTYGNVDATKKLLNRIFLKILSPPDLLSLPQDVQTLRQQAIQEIVREFIQNAVCTVDDVRQQAMDGLTLLAETLKERLGDLLEPHKKLVSEFVPISGSMKSYQMAHQTALLEANQFFLAVTPTIVHYDPDKSDDIEVIKETLEFLVQDDDTLQKKYQCFDFRQYHPLSFLPYRIAAFRFLVAFASFPSVASTIHDALFNTLVHGQDDLLDVTTECLRKFAAQVSVGEPSVVEFITSCKTKLQVAACWNKELTERLCRLQTVYPKFFCEDFALVTFNALPSNLDTAFAEQKEIPHICDGVKKCALMINLLRRTTRDPPKYIPLVLELVAQTEEILMTRNGRQLTSALSNFLLGYAGLVIDMFFNDDKILQPKWTAFFEKLLKGKDELPTEMKQCLTTDKLPLLTNLIRLTDNSGQNWQSLSVGIRILYLLTKKDPQWLVSRSDVITLLREVSRNQAFQLRLKNLTSQHYDTWELSAKLLVLLMVHVRTHSEDFDALFEMTRHASRSIGEGSRWRQFVEYHLVLHLSPQLRRQMFLKWLELIKNRALPEEHLAEIFELIIQPILKQQFMQTEKADQMMMDSGKSDQPGHVHGNLIVIAVQGLLNEEFIYKLTDVLRVACLKLFVLFVENGDSSFPENAPQYKQILARFCYCACTFLQKKERDHIQIDFGTVFQSQNLLAHLSAKFAIPAKFFHTILRSLFSGGASVVEPRGTNKAAIDILLPNLLAKSADGVQLLCRFLRRCVTDDFGNLTHNCIVFQAIVRHQALFFPHRFMFVGIMISNAQKLGLSSSTTLELKKTAVDMIECVVHWEAMKKNVEVDYAEPVEGASVSSTASVKVPKRRTSHIGATKEDRMLDQRTVDSVANMLLRLSFMFGEPGVTDSLGRRCIRILKFFMRIDMYPNADLRLQWIDKILASVDQTPPVQLKTPQIPDQSVQQVTQNNIPSICLALETLTYFIPFLPKHTTLGVIHDLTVTSGSLVKVTTCFNARVAKCLNQLITVLCSTWPGDPVQRNGSLPPQLETLYSQIIKVIHEGLNEFERVTPGPQIHIFCTLMLLKATIPFVPSILDRLLTLVVNSAKKITDEHLSIKSNNQQPPSQDGFVSTELVVIVLDVIKLPAFFTAAGVAHRQTILSIMSDLITRGSDVRVHRALIRIFGDWLQNAEKHVDIPPPIASNIARKQKKKKETLGHPSIPEPLYAEEKKKKKTGNIPKKNLSEAGSSSQFGSLSSQEELQAVTPRELAQLILKLQLQLERKFSDDLELQSLYTTMIYKIFNAEDQKLLDLQQRLINAYMYGLRHPDPEWRKKFYATFDRHYKFDLYERLTTLFTGITWDSCTYTYYIGFCINSLLSVATNMPQPIQLHNVKLILPVTAPTAEPIASHGASSAAGGVTTRRHSTASESVNDSFDSGSPEVTTDEPPRLKELTVGSIVERVYKLNELTKATSLKNMLEGIFQLCHTKNQLANDMWILILPQIWKLLTVEQRDALVIAFRSYLMTQSHQGQRDLVHFPIQAMFDAMLRCEGVQLKLHPMAVLYLGERQNLWYRAACLLEDMAIPPSVILPNQKGGNKALQQQQSHQPSETDSSNNLTQLIHGVLWAGDESLARMYTALGEDDFCAAVWQLRGTLTPKSEPQVPRPMLDFRSALGYERQGMYYQAKDSYEKAMDTFLNDCKDKPAPETEFGELQILTERYAEVLKQLNQWPTLYNVAITETVNNPCLALEAAWHQDSFDVIPTLLQTADKQYPPREELNFGFCKAYNSIHKVLKERLGNPPTAYKDEGVDRLIDCLQQVVIKMWRHLPKIGTMAHRPLIEMATRVGDLKELLNILPGLHNAQSCTSQHVALLKNMVKNWKLRVPGNADDCRFWAEVTDFRSQILTHVINLSTDVQHACTSQDVANTLATFPILSIHTISQNYFSFTKAARMQQLPKLSIEVLWRVQTLPVVPLVDCFERVRNHVLACLGLYNQSNDQSDLQSAMEAIEGVTMQYFTKEMHSELTALKGQVAMQMGKTEDGYKLLSASVQMYENCFDGWMKFADYYETLFAKSTSDLILAKQAVVAYMFAQRSNSDASAREACAKMLALLNHDDATGTISSAIEETGTIIPQGVLVLWIPQLINLMMRKETAQAASVLLTHVAKLHPQPVFLHVRTYFYLMKVMDLSKDSTTPMGASVVPHAASEVKTTSKRRRAPRDLPPLPVEEVKTDSDAHASTSGDGATLRPSLFVMHCISVMRSVRESQPTICNSLEVFANQILGITMSADRWYEDMLAYLNQALKRCYVLAFENRERVMQARMTPSMVQYMNTIVRSFGTGVYQEPGGSVGASKAFGDVASEAITRRAQSLQSSSDYNKLKKDFVKEFDCADPENLKLQAMISKLKKWIRTFEKIVKSHPSHSYLDAHHRALTNFTNLTAEMELPGDFSVLRHLHMIKVVQILPRMDVVFKHNVVCRRIYFVNNVGDTIPYLIISDNANTLEGRKKERILQLFMAINPILDDFPESNRRALKFYVPKITPIAPAVCLVEDSQSSVCIWDIYRKYCDKKNIDSDGPIMKFYERIVANAHRNQAAVTQTVLRDCLKETQLAMVQPRVLRDYFGKLYSNVDEYFLFRKTLIRSHAILCVAEHVLRLTKLTPDMMHVHTETGVLGVFSYTFDLDERSGEMFQVPSVPFRLTPNLTEIFTCYGVQGPLHQSMVAAARAFEKNDEKFKAFVKTIFSDELTYWMVFRKEMSLILAFSDAVVVADKGEASAGSSSPTKGGAQPVSEPNLQNLALRGTRRIFSNLQQFAKYEGSESEALKSIASAKSPDNLCRMDPSWHPWL